MRVMECIQVCCTSQMLKICPNGQKIILPISDIYLFFKPFCKDICTLFVINKKFDNSLNAKMHDTLLFL